MSFKNEQRLPIERWVVSFFDLAMLKSIFFSFVRYISHLLYEIPVPSAERPRILAQLSPDESIMFTRPEDLPLPPSCASFTTLLGDLGVEKTLDVFLYALMGESMLVHSVRPSVLTLACEALKTMIFPFIWSFPFIPFCPLNLSEAVHCPMGFIIGVDTAYFDLYEPPPEVICIDLDTAGILLPREKKHLTAKLFPKAPRQQLHQRLEKIYKSLQRQSAMFNEYVDIHNEISHEKFEMRKQRETALELECREAFLFFMATVLRGYHQYLIMPTNVVTKTNLDAESLFRIKEFVRTRDKSLAKFFELLNLADSQCFAKFIEELTFSSRPQAFDFFTECCRKVDDMMSGSHNPTKLIESSRDFDNERTVVIPPPSSINLTEGETYNYNHHFPKLDPRLFLEPPEVVGVSSELSNGHDSLANRFLQQQQQTNGGSNGSSLNLAGTVTTTVTNWSGRQTFDWSIIKRTRQEIKSSSNILHQKSSVPHEWAKIIEAQYYSVWFCVLPAFCRLVNSRKKLLSYAVTTARHWAGFSDSLGNDQTPYRIIFALADVYRHPAVAVQLLMRIRMTNFEPNAATLALCNKVLYQTSWQADSQSRPARAWRLLSNVVMAVAAFQNTNRSLVNGKQAKSQQSLLSLSAGSDQVLNIPASGSGTVNGGSQSLMVPNGSQQGAVMVTSTAIHPSVKNQNDASMIYSPRLKAPPSFGKFPPPETPLFLCNQMSLQPTKSNRLGDYGTSAESQHSLNSSYQTDISYPLTPLHHPSHQHLNQQQSWSSSQSNAYASPYLREKMGKTLDFLTSKTQDLLQAAGRKTSTSSTSGGGGGGAGYGGGRRFFESQSSFTVDQSPIQVAGPNINIQSPTSDSDSVGAMDANNSGSNTSLFKRMMTTPQKSMSLDMKESKSTPQFLSSHAFSSGFKKMGSAVKSAVQTTVEHIANATINLPSDGMIDYHAESSLYFPQRQPSISSLSVRSQEDAAVPFQQQQQQQSKPADVCSLASQVTSDSTTNGSNSAMVCSLTLCSPIFVCLYRLLIMMKFTTTVYEFFIDFK